MGLESVGAPGTTAALVLLNDQVKKGSLMADSFFGGLSGAFIPVSEGQGMINQKTTAVRLIPVVGKDVGDTVEFGGFLGYAPIQRVNTFSCEDFINRGGRIPAPIHSFKN